MEECKIKKLYNLEEIKRGYSIGNEFNNVAEKDKGMVYTKNMPLQDNAAFVAYVQIFAIVFSIAPILSALVIYVVSKYKDEFNSSFLFVLIIYLLVLQLLQLIQLYRLYYIL